MTVDEFRASLTLAEPPSELQAALAALWWDAKGDWTHSHGIVDDLTLKKRWPFTPTCTAKRGLLGTLTTGTTAPAANSTGLRLKQSGKRWSRGYCARRAEQPDCDSEG